MVSKTENGTQQSCNLNSLYVGRDAVGSLSRALMRFPALDLRGVTSGMPQLSSVILLIVKSVRQQLYTSGPEAIASGPVLRSDRYCPISLSLLFLPVKKNILHISSENRLLSADGFAIIKANSK